MKYIKCDNCDKLGIPLNDSITIDSKLYCNSCYESNFQVEDDLKGKNIVREPDSTVCSFCGKDNGNTDLQKISNNPICEECELKMKTRAFPSWVKLFFSIVILLIIFSYIWNWRFYQAYRDLNKSNDFAAEGKFEKATTLMLNASNKVPEINDIKLLATYYNGIDLLDKDKSSQALDEFIKCRQKLPENYNIETLIVKAQMGKFFDDKDFEGFLSASKQSLALDTTVAISWASVASAFACIYASKRQDSAKTLSILYLTRAKSMDSTTAELKEYYNMIEHRLYVQQIITLAEFKNKYPKGWTKP